MRHPPASSAEWQQEPGFPIVVSQAIIDGIHYLIDEIFISESWFRGTDISIHVDGEPLLTAQVTFVTLSGKGQHFLTKWQLIRRDDKNLSYKTAFYIDSKKRTVFAIGNEAHFVNSPNKLFLDIGQLHYRQDYEDTLPHMTLTFWRSLAQKDPFARLQLSDRMGDRYATIESLAVPAKGQQHR